MTMPSMSTATVARGMNEATMERRTILSEAKRPTKRSGLRTRKARRAEKPAASIPAPSLRMRSIVPVMTMMKSSWFHFEARYGLRAKLGARTKPPARILTMASTQ
jgi:hypothetical protein